MKIHIKPSFWKRIHAENEEKSSPHSLKNMLKKVYSQDMVLIAMTFLNAHKTLTYKKLKQNRAKIVHALSKAIINQEGK